jgi:glycosyltransferase involved in cell wall biosynthesis
VLPKKKELGFYTKEGFSIILLANLRMPKNHLNLLKAFRIVLNQKPECKLILVGKDFKDEYSEEIKLYIQEQTLQEHVRIAGVQSKLDSFLQTSQLGVLSSDSEGLPVSLLEYGLAGLPVVCTDVGNCRKVIGDFGKLVPIKNPEALGKAILFYLNNNDMMNSDAKNFQKKTIENYSEKTVLPKFLKFYKEILSECGN